uniref:Interleukin-7 n=1 Tax=Apteryx owenii TaxID=8824 RepID=A0A8B9PJR7_APTOW
MYLYFFLLLLSSRASSCFLHPKETSFLQNKTISALIDEMLCLLEAENENLERKFHTPIHVKNKNCADSHTEEFIKELEKIPSHTCIKRVKADLERLRENCPILKKSLPHGKKCSEITANFQHFKKNLEDFLKWLNQNKECNNIVISEPDFYTDGECTCPDR